jgi:D-glycero-D-manno-heptose 1,7-bisphosphate phosphatase
MLKQADKDHGIDYARSYFVGDRPEDIACGYSVGAETILVLTGKNAVYDPARFPCPPDHVCANLPEATDWILSRK